MKKVKKVKKIVLNRETLGRLQPEETTLRQAPAGAYTGPSCEIFRACTLAGWDC